MRKRPRRRAAALTRPLAALAALLALAAGGACSQERPPPRHRVTFEVYSDLNPLPGVQLLVRGRAVGQTDASGTVRLEVPGRDGTVIPFQVRCPDGTRSPEAPVEITVRSLQVIDRSAAARGIVHRVNCPPVDRSVAVVVRTNGRQGLPVTWQGREISRTDAAGVANVVFRAHPNTQILLALNTAAQPQLQPQNPTMPITVRDGDQVVVFAQDFDEAAPARAPRPPRRPSGGGGGIRRPRPLPLLAPR